MILDTTFLVDLLRNEDSVIRMIKQLQTRNVPISITTPSIVEIWTGLVHSRKSKAERDKILDVLESQIVLGLDLESAKRAGRINGNSMKKGEPIGIVDSMIAGIAHKNKEPVLTRNVKHFGRVKGIEVETY